MSLIMPADLEGAVRRQAARISVFRLVAIAIVCGAGLLTGLSAVVFGASIVVRLMGALFSLGVLGFLAVIAWARSSPSG